MKNTLTVTFPNEKDVVKPVLEVNGVTASLSQLHTQKTKEGYRVKYIFGLYSVIDDGCD